MIVRPLLLLPTLTLLLTTAVNAADPIRILCVGDSITQGGKSDREELSYRHPLQEILKEAGIAFDFVGSQTKGLQENAVWPEVGGTAFDPDHEGYYGFKTAAVLGKLRGNLDSFAAPDVVLIHLGTNDQKHGNFEETVVAPLREIIGLLRKRNDKVVVLLGHLNFTAGAALEIRSLVEKLALELDTKTSPVKTVPHYRGWVPNPKQERTDTFDWAHPNRQGQRKMAKAWFAAMQPHLPAKAGAAERELPLLPTLTDEDRALFGKGIQRTMRLLEESTPERRNTVRVLLYGQSITEGNWSAKVADRLRERYPHANLIIENRALGGYASQRLVKTAETDLFSFLPDLMIFHVFGAHGDYERIIELTRKRTTSEVLIQTDHIGAKQAWRKELTDPAKITMKQWSSFMNYVHLPRVSTKYGCGLLDQRNLWKRYLAENEIEAQVLLSDGIHLNEAGNRLMAALVDQALVRTTQEVEDPMNCGYVTTLEIGKDIAWPESGPLELEFDGNRIDLVAAPSGAGAVKIQIDGKKPSEHPQLYGRTRALAKPGGKWPVLSHVQLEGLPQVETWTMKVRRDPPDGEVLAFSLSGSVTGADGSGRSDKTFVSDSGRVSIAPGHWDVTDPLKLAGIDPVPEVFDVTWEVVAHHLDECRAAPSEPGIENAVTIAHGLEDAPHRLSLTGENSGWKAVRIYSPKRFPR